MRLGWLQGELALGLLQHLHHAPRLGSSFRKLGLIPPLKALAWELDASRGAGPAPAAWVRLVARSVQQWQGDAPPFSAGRGGESGAVWQGKASREPPRHRAMRRVLGARVGSAAAGAGADRVEGGAEAGSSALACRARWRGSCALQRGRSKEPRSTRSPGGPFSVLPGPGCQSRMPEGSTLTPAPLELRCCWALGCLGHAVVGLGQGHVAWQAVAAVGALRVLAGAAPAQGLRAAHLLALVDVCKEKDRGEPVAE